MAVDLTRVRAAVARNRTVDGSAIEFIRSVPQLIREAIAADDVEDATNLNALADDIEASTTELASAITENTPAATGVITGDRSGGEGGGSEPPANP